MNRKLLTALLATALLLWLVGCSESPSQPADEEVLNLDSEFGGYTAEAESPGFGDNDLLGEEATVVEYSDEILASPEVDSVISDPRSVYYHLRAVWGRLCYDSTVTTVTDWSGTLNVPGGVDTGVSNEMSEEEAVGPILSLIVGQPVESNVDLCDKVLQIPGMPTRWVNGAIDRTLLKQLSEEGYIGQAGGLITAAS